MPHGAKMQIPAPNLAATAANIAQAAQPTHALCAACGEYAYQAPRLAHNAPGLLSYLSKWLTDSTKGGRPTAADISVTRWKDDPHAQVEVRCATGSLHADLNLASILALRDALTDAVIDIQTLQAARHHKRFAAHGLETTQAVPA
jgi:hypothetical protein